MSISEGLHGHGEKGEERGGSAPLLFNSAICDQEGKIMKESHSFFFTAKNRKKKKKEKGEDATFASLSSVNLRRRKKGKKKGDDYPLI